jgi:hypothetical protein
LLHQAIGQQFDRGKVEADDSGLKSETVGPLEATGFEVGVVKTLIESRVGDTHTGSGLLRSQFCRQGVDESAVGLYDDDEVHRVILK